MDGPLGLFRLEGGVDGGVDDPRPSLVPFCPTGMLDGPLGPFCPIVGVDGCVVPLSICSFWDGSMSGA